MELLFKDYSSDVKLCLLEINYLISDCEFALVILQQTDYLNNIFMFLEKSTEYRALL
jgi:hypothetical protein